ncbi:MAG: hypothetical protein AAGI30_13295 [Planctomycetota bacterium]
MLADLVIPIVCLAMGAALAMACTIGPRRDEATGNALRSIAFGALVVNAAAVIAAVALDRAEWAATIAAWPALGASIGTLVRRFAGRSQDALLGIPNATPVLIVSAVVVFLAATVGEVGFIEAQLIAIASLAWVAGPFAPLASRRALGDAYAGAFASAGGLAGLGIGATLGRWLDLARDARVLQLGGVGELEAVAGAFGDRPTLLIDAATPWLGAALLVVAAALVWRPGRP